MSIDARRPVSRPALALEELIEEYVELPPPGVTVAQAQRLWRLGERQCANILNALVEAGVLADTPYGYVRC